MKTVSKAALIFVYFVLFTVGAMAAAFSSYFTAGPGAPYWTANLQNALLMGFPILGVAIVAASAFRNLPMPLLVLPAALTILSYPALLVLGSSHKAGMRALPMQATPTSYRCNENEAITIPEYTGAAPVYYSRRDEAGSVGASLVGHLLDKKLTLEKWVLTDQERLQLLRDLIDSKECKNAAGVSVDTVIAEIANAN